MRLSSKSLTNALIDGICSTGMNVVNIGIVSTEMTTFAVGHYNYDGGVMSYRLSQLRRIQRV